MHKIPLGDLPIIVVFLVVLVAIGTLVGAIILRAAIGLCNTITGGSKSPDATKEPSILSAMLISFVAGLVSGAITLVVEFLKGAPEVALRADNFRTTMWTAIPLGWLIIAFVLSAMLATTFVRALIISLFYYILWAILVGGILVIGMAALNPNFGS